MMRGDELRLARGRDEVARGVGCGMGDDEDQPRSAGLNDAVCRQGAATTEFLGSLLISAAQASAHSPRDMVQGIDDDRALPATDGALAPSADRRSGPGWMSGPAS